MAWTKIGSKTSEDYSEPLDGTGTNYPKVVYSSPVGWMLRSHYIVRMNATAYQDSGNKNRYRVTCKVQLCNAYKYWGGVWNGSKACTLKFEFFDKNGNEMKVKFDNGTKDYDYSIDIDLNNLSCWDSTGGKWHTAATADQFAVNFITTETTIVGCDINCHKGGAGRSPESAGKTLSNYLPTKSNQINVPSGESKVNAENYTKAKGSAGFHGWIYQGITISKFEKPTFKLVEVTKALGGGINNHKFTIKYNLNRGSSPINQAKLYIMDVDDKTKLGEIQLPKNSDGNYTEGNNKTFTFDLKNILGNNFANATKYTVKIYVYDKDGDDTYEGFSSSKKIVTYREPTLTRVDVTKADVAVSPNTIEGSSDQSTTSHYIDGSGVRIARGYHRNYPVLMNARTGIQFNLIGTNDCRWESWGEAKFRSEMRSEIDNDWIGKGGSSQDSSKAKTPWNYYGMGETAIYGMSAENTRKLFPFTRKYYDTSGNYIRTETQVNGTVRMQFRRKSDTANWSTSGQNLYIKLIYIPEQSVSNVLYKKNGSSGAAMNYDTQAKRTITDITGYTGIYTYWTYDDTTPESGYIQGYRIQLQYYNGEWKSYKTYYTSNKNYTIPIGDVPRMFSSRLVITPYYANGQSKIADASVASNYKYASNTYQTIVNFFTVTSGIVKPTISLPKTNTTWFNKDFRVCFVLPVDNDMAWLQANEPSIANDYKYGDIEVYIDDGTVRKYLISNSTQADIYSISASNMLYQRPVVVWPNKLETSTKGSYTVKIKVKKNLAYTNNQEIWSAYSDAITINVSHPTYNPQQNYPVLASHYNTMADMVNKARNVYGITSINPISNVTAGTTVISALQYKYNVSVTMANLIKGTVNDYGGAYSKGSITTAYDRSVIKFDTGNKIKNSASSFNPKGKADNVNTFITANIDSSSATASGDYSSTRTGANYIKWIYEQFDYLK